MKPRQKAKEKTRLEQVTSTLPSAQLVDYLQMYFNSAGTAAVVYARDANMAALDVIEENLTALGVIVDELKSRRADAFYPAPSPHLDELVAKFALKNGLEPAQRGL